MAQKKAELALVADKDKTVTFDFNPEDIAYKVTIQTRSTPNLGSRPRTAGNGSTGPGANALGNTQQPGVQPTPGGTAGSTGGSASGTIALTMKTFFVKPSDAGAPESKSVTARVDSLVAWTQPLQPDKNKDPGIKGRRAQAPMLSFTWGKAFTDFKCFLTALTAKYVRFDPDGTPSAAQVEITLTQVPQPNKGTNPTSGGLAPIGGHILRAGDSLPSVAYQTYGEARFWRALARVNGIDDPFRLRLGTTLRLPTLSELEAGN